ncbi:16459_t:CDS:1, partial [Racocetra fulgida]
IAGQIARARNFQRQDLSAVSELVNADQQTHVTGFQVIEHRVRQICNTVTYNIFDPTVIHEIAKHIWTDHISSTERDMYTNLASRVNEQKFGRSIRDPGIIVPPASTPLVSIPQSDFSDQLINGTCI